MFSSFLYALRNLKGRQGMVVVALLVLVTFVAAESQAHTDEESTWASFKYAVLFRVFSVLAEQGVVSAQDKLAFMYEEGRGTPRDKAEARRWYLQAAEQGNTHAQFHLVNMSRKGQVSLHDEAEAVRWYRQAAEQEDALARINLGFMYEGGLGVPQDDAEAVRWYRQAAEQEHALARFRLGFMYRDGKGVPQSDVQAYQWFTSVVSGLSSSERDRDLRDSAARLRSEVASNMTPEQVAEAERLASEQQSGRR